MRHRGQLDPAQLRHAASWKGLRDKRLIPWVPRRLVVLPSWKAQNSQVSNLAVVFVEIPAGSALESNTILSLHRTQTAMVRCHLEKEHIAENGAALRYMKTRNNHKTGSLNFTCHNLKRRVTLEVVMKSWRVGLWQGEKCKLQESEECSAQDTGTDEVVLHGQKQTSSTENNPGIQKPWVRV